MNTKIYQLLDSLDENRRCVIIRLNKKELDPDLTEQVLQELRKADTALDEAFELIMNN